MSLSLYVHFPFCIRKCSYCDFNSFADLPVSFETYVDAVVREMEMRAASMHPEIPADTFYFGGGTPSLMSSDLVRRMIQAARKCYGLAEDAEITLEANPGTVTAETLSGFRDAGVNRLSLGIQSFDDRFLARLGRVHSAREAIDACAAARTAGFDNLAIDLIHSLPEQTVEEWSADLLTGISLAPEHVAAYGLSVEEGTPFSRMQEEGELLLPSEETTVRMFERTIELLQDNGYEHYEISNFARPGCRSRHNQVYWEMTSYLGFGAGAHSFSSGPGFGCRWCNDNSPATYVKDVETGLRDRNRMGLTREDAQSERIFLGLRKLEGIVESEFEQEFGIPMDVAFPGAIPRLLQGGMLERRAGRLRLTNRGLLLFNQVVMEFI